MGYLYLFCLQPKNFSQWQLRHIGLWTRLRFLLSPSWAVRSRNTRATGLTVVTFSSESVCSFSHITPFSSIRSSQLTWAVRTDTSRMASGPGNQHVLHSGSLTRWKGEFDLWPDRDNLTPRQLQLLITIRPPRRCCCCWCRCSLPWQRAVI